MVQNHSVMPVVLKNGWISIDTRSEKQVPETNIVTIVALTILTGGLFLIFWLPGWISDRKTLKVAPATSKAQEIKIAPAPSAKVTDSFNAFQTAWKVLLKINRSTVIDKKNQAIKITKTKLIEYTNAAKEAQGALSDDVDLNAETCMRAADHFEYLVNAIVDAADENKEITQGLIKAADIALEDVEKSYFKIYTAHQKNKKALMDPLNIYGPRDITHLRTIFCSTAQALLSATHAIQRAERASLKLQTNLPWMKSQNVRSI
jgi:hypothetical protein